MPVSFSGRTGTCLSTDIKPEMPAGFLLIETDTQQIFSSTATGWQRAKADAPQDSALASRIDQLEGRAGLLERSLELVSERSGVQVAVERWSSRADILTRWNTLGPNVWQGDGKFLYANGAESSAIRSKKLYARTKEILISATVYSESLTPSATGRIRHYTHIGFVAEDDPVASYATIGNSRNVLPIGGTVDAIGLTHGMSGQVLRTLPGPETHRVKLHFRPQLSNRLDAYIDDVLTRTITWNPTRDFELWVLCVALEGGQVGPERCNGVVGPLYILHEP